jgi:hypothetical protein
MDQNLDEKVSRLSFGNPTRTLLLMLTRSLNAGFEGFGARAPYRNLSWNGDYERCWNPPLYQIISWSWFSLGPST